MRGDEDRPIRGVRALPDAGPEYLSLLIQARYRTQAAESAAGALLVGRDSRGEPLLGADLGRDLLLVDDPPRALARLLELFHPRRRPEPGIHPTAVVDAEARVDAEAHVGPYAVVGAGSRLAAGVVVEAHAVVGGDCRLGQGCHLHPHAVLYPGTELGARCIVHSGAVLGADGFGYASSREGHLKVPQVGRVVLGDDVEVGANSAVDRATLGTTRIGSGTKIDNLVQVGHNVEVGRRGLLCGQAGIAGSARLGDGVVLAGQAGVVGHLDLGDGVQVAAKSAVMGDVEAGGKVAGIPAEPLAAWRRQVVRLSRLDRTARQVRQFEERLTRLEESVRDPATAETKAEPDRREKSSHDRGSGGGGDSEGGA